MDNKSNPILVVNVPPKQEIHGTPFDENELRSIIRKATKGRRHIIAARMTGILHRDITPKMFAEFCREAPGRRHTRFPAAWVRTFCEATGNDDLAICLLADSARRAVAASAGILQSREAVSRAQEALGRVQAELEKLAEGKRHRKPISKDRKA